MTTGCIAEGIFHSEKFNSTAVAADHSVGTLVNSLRGYPDVMDGNGADVISSKVPLPVEDLDPSVTWMVPWSYSSPHPKRHLSRFSRFCRLTVVTNRQTDRPRYSVCSSRPHLASEIGKRISVNTGASRQTGFLFQRASVLMQRFNAIVLHDTLPAADCTD